jgi:hypothetical protein
VSHQHLAPLAAGGTEFHLDALTLRLIWSFNESVLSRWREKQLLLFELPSSWRGVSGSPISTRVRCSSMDSMAGSNPELTTRGNAQYAKKTPIPTIAPHLKNTWGW